MKELVKITMLLDYYGTLLTEKQSQILKMYYEEDYSLAEIADTYNITRQAAFDAIKKGEAVLNKYEQALNLAQKQTEKEKTAQEIRNLLNKLTVNQAEAGVIVKIEKLVDKITE
ncbi:MAG: putative DNA-binding protein [Eubacteriaceae bacterium]|nr:putative DNA-binding protein [Eubacteriaceae bacterium]